MTSDEFLDEQVDIINKLVLPDGISRSHLQDIINEYIKQYPPKLRVQNFSEMGSWISYDTPSEISHKRRMGSKFSVSGYIPR